MRTPVLTLSAWQYTLPVPGYHAKKWFHFDPRMQHWFMYEVFWNWSQCIKSRGPTDQEESDWHNMMSGCEL